MKSAAPYVLAVAAAFFVYLLYLLANSFQAVYRIYQTVFSATSPSFWSLVWFSSEFIGEIGLITRFAGAIFFVVFIWWIFRKKELRLPILGKAVPLEGAYYLFILPFVIYLFTRPYSSQATQTVGQEAAFSYVLQTILATPVFLLLSARLKKPNLDPAKLFKLVAIGITNYTFALWVKHFLLNLYALSINLSDPVLVLGFFNSALTLLIAASILLATLLPVIRGKRTGFNPKGLGAGLVLIGAYSIIYVVVALLNQSYLSFLALTELWVVAMPIAGLFFLRIERNFIDLLA